MIEPGSLPGFCFVHSIVRQSVLTERFDFSMRLASAAPDLLEFSPRDAPIFARDGYAARCIARAFLVNGIRSRCGVRAMIVAKVTLLR